MVDQQKSADTKAGMERARARGVRLGRPSKLTPEIRARIARERAESRSLRQIAAGLNRDQIPTGHDAPAWSAGTVAWILRTLEQQRTRSKR